MSNFISIITPTYNRGHLIHRAIKSVLNQSYENFEYLIVDDASTDNTQEVVNAFDDNRIRYIRYEENGGNAVARNVGVQNAKGDYIAFLDSDDEFLENFLSKALKQLENEPEASFLWSGTRTIKIDGSYNDRIWVPQTRKHPNQFLYELHVGIGRGFLIKKECFKDLKFDERLRTAVDTDFLIRLRQNFTFTILQEIMLNIHTQPGSVRANFSEKKKSYATIISKHKNIIDNDRKLSKKWYYKLFWLSLYDNDFSLAREAYSKIGDGKAKAGFLYLIFRIFPTDQAIKLHKQLSH
ncbi:glycosyltransferase [Pontixanthobacter gangjinensis]|uniref:Glycosyltransferase n=1 Tax=Christiangramia aestuarii TaxID=1028746 RepID=A0A7M3SWS9_9FLAO|nr:glycosyltransferase [Christiangramia aestuarii]MUP41060.1 glycosyltransferase [Christiangramia aestuarii]